MVKITMPSAAITSSEVMRRNDAKNFDTTKQALQGFIDRFRRIRCQESRVSQRRQQAYVRVSENPLPSSEQMKVQLRRIEETRRATFLEFVPP
jgi:hypothetical protein